MPEALAAARKTNNLPVPSAIGGMFLLDTGAAASCIGEETAKALQLTAVGLGSGFGAGGQHKYTMYAARLLIEIENEDTAKKLRIEMDQPVQGIPDLERHMEKNDLKVKGQPAKVIGLLGRDLLRHMTITYDGPQGVLKAKFHLETMTQGSTARPALPPPPPPAPSAPGSNR